MPSNALHDWKKSEPPPLDQLEHAHARVGGKRPGRRFATEHINQSYAMMLSSQFQGFCRDLHTECSGHLAAAIAPSSLIRLFIEAFKHARKLDTGNPTPGNLGSDFVRFGVAFWPEVYNQDRRNRARLHHIEELNRWRNAIAHQDYAPDMRTGGQLRLAHVQDWRQACHQLDSSFDEVMRRQLELLLGASPWCGIMKNGKSPKPHIRAGDTVRFNLGRARARADILEVCGRPGGLPPYYRVNIFQDPLEPYEWTVDEDKLELADPIEDRKPLARDAIIDFFKGSGLEAILMMGSSPDTLEAQVWLCRDSLENITYTPKRRRGVIGGANIPAHTLTWNGKILPERVPEVMEFLGHFGLIEHEARDIVNAVGIARRKVKAAKPAK